MAAARGGILCVGIDDGHVKACLCDQVSGAWRLVNWLVEQTPLAERAQFEAEADRETVVPSIQWALNTLGQFMGCDLQHALLPQQQAHESSSAAYQLDRVLLTASASPPLTVWVMTLTPLWLPRLEEIVHSQRAHVIGVTLLQGNLPAWRLRQELLSGQPDLLLICGGYDGEPEKRQDRSSTVSLLTECLALYESPLQIVFAGQSEFAPELLEGIRAGGRFEPVAIPNISPHPEYFRFGPLQEVLAALQSAREVQGIGMDAAQTWGLEEVGLLSISESFTRAPPCLAESQAPRYGTAWCIGIRTPQAACAAACGGRSAGRSLARRGSGVAGSVERLAPCGPGQWAGASQLSQGGDAGVRAQGVSAPDCTPVCHGPGGWLVHIDPGSAD